MRQIPENASLYDLIMEYARQQKVYKYKQFLPLYIASVGCHVLNLWNKRFNPFNSGIKRWKKIYDYWFTDEAEYRAKQKSNSNQSAHYDYLWLHREPEDLRLHIFFVAPPAFGKTLIQDIFLGSINGCINIKDYSNRWRFLPIVRLNTITEAALTGTAKNTQEAKVKRFPGIAEKTPHAIIGVDEANGLFPSRPESFNVNRENQLLTCLDSGRMGKATGLSSKEIQTFLTFWCAAQPARFTMRSGEGFDRRFAWMVWLPKFSDVRYILDLNYHHPDIKTPFALREEIQSMLLGIYRRFNLRYLEWSPELLKYIYILTKRFKQPHNDMKTYRKIALGYCFMKFYKPGYSKLTIIVTRELKKILIRTARWKDKVFEGDLLEIHLKSLIGELHGQTIDEFKRSVRALKYPAEQIVDKIRILRNNNDILILKRREKGRDLERIYSSYITNSDILKLLHLDDISLRKIRLRSPYVFQYGSSKTLWTDRKTFWELYEKRNDDRQLLEDPVRAEERGYRCWIDRRYYTVKIVRSKGILWRRYYMYMRKAKHHTIPELNKIRSQSQFTENRIRLRGTSNSKKN